MRWIKLIAMAFGPHFLKLLTLRQVEVRVTIQPKVDCSRYEDNSAGRKRLAEDCYNRVLGRVNKRDYVQEGEERALANSRSPAMYQGEFVSSCHKDN